MREFLIEKLTNLDLNFDELFFQRCEDFAKLLQKWGRVHNLSANLETNSIIENIYDSLKPLKFINDFSSFVDVGTGCGYPGMVLAIAKPNIKTYLVEPRSKRAAFLNFVKNSLKLESVKIIAKRIEDFKTQDRFDLITSRAVTNTSLLLNLTKHISNENTSYLFYKGSNLEKELENDLLENCEIINSENRKYLYIKNKGKCDV